MGNPRRTDRKQTRLRIYFPLSLFFRCVPIRDEQEHYPIPHADPVSVVRFLLEHQGLTQRDLIPQFGSESAVSMFLAGRRQLTVGQIRKLAARFKLPADVFLKG